jgi:hypothetical protein
MHVKDGNVMIDGATVVASVRCGNGIVHVLDAVVLPPEQRRGRGTQPAPWRASHSASSPGSGSTASHSMTQRAGTSTLTTATSSRATPHGGI